MSTHPWHLHFCAFVFAALLSGCGDKNYVPTNAKLIEKLPVLTSSCEIPLQAEKMASGREKISDECSNKIDKALNKEGILRASTLLRTHEGDTFVVGGYDGETESDRTWFWNIQKQALSEGPRLSQKRAFANVIELDDGRFVISGGNGINRFLAPIEICQGKESQCSILCELYFPRTDHSIVQISDHELLVSGGMVDVEDSDHDGITSSMELIDLLSQKRICLGKLQHARYGHQTFVIGSEVIFHGGYDRTGLGKSELLARGSDPSKLLLHTAEKCSISSIRDRFRQSLKGEP